MKQLILSSLVAAAAGLVSVQALACDGSEHTAQNQSVPEQKTAAKAQKKELAKLSVDELDKLLGQGSATVSVVDANNPETREKQGVIPGAVLLTSSSQYDVKELPAQKDRKLVFYCANEHCGASHKAAKRARDAGWSDVAVLPAGIMGWKKAGKSTGRPPQS